MKDQGQTEKDVVSPADARGAPTSDARKTTGVDEELTDEQLAAVSGGATAIQYALLAANLAEKAKAMGKS